MVIIVFYPIENYDFNFIMVFARVESELSTVINYAIQL